MGPGVTSGLCMNGMNKPLATVDAVRSEKRDIPASAAYMFVYAYFSDRGEDESVKTTLLAGGLAGTLEYKFN